MTDFFGYGDGTRRENYFQRNYTLSTKKCRSVRTILRFFHIGVPSILAYLGALLTGFIAPDWGSLVNFSGIVSAGSKYYMESVKVPELDAKTVTVSSQVELKAALQSATAGTTILLKDGNYGDLTITNQNFSDNVTIKAQNNQGARFSDVTLSSSSHIQFDGVSFNRQENVVSWDRLVEIRKSSFISIINSSFSCSADKNFANDSDALSADNSSHLRFENNIFHDVQMGITLATVSDSIVKNNNFTNIATTPANGETWNNIKFEGNIYGGPHPVGDLHYDFVHIWATAQADVSHNVTIRDNVMIENGDAPAIGFFIENDKVATDPTALHQNILFENNLLYGSHGNGILVQGTDGVSVINNTLLARGDSGPNINIYKQSKNITIDNNVITQKDLGASNFVVQKIDPGESNFYDKLFLNVLPGTKLADFLPVPGSAVDFGKGVGAQQLLSAIDKPLVYIQSTTPSAELDCYKLTFTALPYPGGGLVDGPGVGYLWDFGDGAKAAGKTVTHAFGTTGVLQINVTVTSGGTSETYGKQVLVKNPLLVDLTFNNALGNEGGARGTLSWTTSPSYGGGKDGAAANFEVNGVNYVKFSGAGTDLSGMRQLTFSFDLRSDGLTTRSRPLWLSDAYGIDILSDKTVNLYLATASGIAPVISVKVPQAFDGGWHHLTATYDGLTGTAVLYLDGNSIGTKFGLSGRINATTRELTIGSDPWGSGFDGQIDNLRIYSGVVPPNQEQKIYDSLHSLKSGMDDGGGGTGTGVTDNNGGGQDTVGGGGQDTVGGGTGGDSTHHIVGGVGDDLLAGGAGADVIDGGGGTDTLSYAASTAGVTVNLATGVGSGGDAAGDTFANVENVVGSSQDDVLTGNALGNVLAGGAGNDVLAGGAGDDLLAGGAGADQLDGGDGVDTANYTESATGVTVNLATGVGSGGDAAGDTLINIENILGSPQDDVLTGNALANVLTGGAGNDLLYGGAGNDLLVGGDGKDTLIGQAGDDTLDSGTGYDAASFTKATQGVIVDLAAGTAAGEGRDVLRGIEEVFGSAYADSLSGDAGNNWFTGGAGNDTLDGRGGTDTASYVTATTGVVVDLAAGSASGQGSDRLISIEAVIGSAQGDRLYGGSGNDQLMGGAGNDTIDGRDGNDRLLGDAGNELLAGGAGTDVLIGGAGEDFFWFRSGYGNDSIQDFTKGVDHIYFSAMGLHFADLHIVSSGVNTLITAGDDLITLVNVSPTALDASDFIFG